MSEPVMAVQLMRGLGLDADGPLRWGARPQSGRPGVFVVELLAPLTEAPIDQAALRRWLETVPDLRLDGERPTPMRLGQRLAAFWLPGQPLLYIGRASRALGPRVAALYATPLGRRRPHAGGHWLKTLREPSRLRIWWAETDAAEEYEDGLLGAFADAVQRGAPGASDRLLPWANLETPTGDRRSTGITDALVSEDEAQRPGTPEAPPRGGRSGPTRRAAPVSRAGAASGATGAPRRRPTHSPGPPAPAPTHVTPAGLAALQAELDVLVRVRRPEVVQRVKHARELGDLRENAEYETARHEQSLLEGRIRSLEGRIRTAVLIEADGAATVGLGSTVVAEHEDETIELTIVGSSEADPTAGRISMASPVGGALLGHQAGDEVRVRLRAGERLYRIIEVR